MAKKKPPYVPKHLRPEPSSPAQHEAPAHSAEAKKAPARRLPGRTENAGKRRRAPVNRPRAEAKPEADNSELFEKTLLPMVESVHKLDQAALRVGVTWLYLLPIMLLIIRRVTDSSKLTFLIIWVIGMFIISAALILIGYSDHQLKRFLEEVKRYEPAAAGEALDSVMNRGKDSPYALPLAPDLMLRTMQRKEARRNAKHPANR